MRKIKMNMKKYLIFLLCIFLFGCSKNKQTINNELDETKFTISMNACKFMENKYNRGVLELVYENIYRHLPEGPTPDFEDSLFFDCGNLTYMSYQNGKIVESYNMYQKYYSTKDVLLILLKTP